MSMTPLFFTVRGNMEKESHGEEKEEEREIEDLKRASLALGQLSELRSPQSRHRLIALECPLRATSRHQASSETGPRTRGPGRFSRGPRSLQSRTGPVNSACRRISGSS